MQAYAGLAMGQLTGQYVDPFRSACICVIDLAEF